MTRKKRANTQACEDYRASATIDLEHDRADLLSGHKISIPHLKVIWGGRGMIDTLNDGDVEGIWRGYCEDTVELSMERFDCGHYIAEEKPGELIKSLEGYL
jgi:haloacetate dehalogenase